MRYLTAGESHGPQLTVIIEGLPSQLSLDKEKIDRELARRQKGYGRGRRMQIEKDQVKILSGVRFGKTTGAPVTLVIENRDFTHWKKVMSVDPIPEEAEKRKISRPRPGHADLNGAIKYQHRDMRDVLERSSARETAARVAAGAVARLILEECGIRIAGHVVRIGDVVAEPVDLSFEEMVERAELSPVRCLDQNAEEKMMALIDQAKKEGDSLGGVVETIVQGVPVGLGSHVIGTANWMPILRVRWSASMPLKESSLESVLRPPSGRDPKSMTKSCGQRNAAFTAGPTGWADWKAE